ncbi:hypothetical protein ISN36_18445 [Xanthomonas translucens pv. undulosa]|uniref:hypothetical protein n=1 Tax=Xanthomonas campestris pv. translucens TaxID=343 RepID=UPI0019D6FE9E|nr:hypothetical protein [Xanthomonas translucens]QSQ52582.1 hypothetical protein ISN36_18445 [Xanthomonas translucens pv. undulosa]QSQ61809.1 hypothetical protein ISN38_09295 [Xanthomonas translucens pv. undulosa]
MFRCDRARYADLTVTFAILSKTLTARLLKLCTSGSASAERGGRMQSEGNQRRWLLWIVLLATAAASAEASAQQDQAQQQIQQQLQQQQQLQLQLQLQQQSSANPNAPKGLSAAYLDCRKQASGVYANSAASNANAERRKIAWHGPTTPCATGSAAATGPS